MRLKDHQSPIGSGKLVLDHVQILHQIDVLLFERAHLSPQFAKAVVRFHLILGDGETTAFGAGHRLLLAEVALLEVAGHQVQLDHSRASEGVVLASERRSGT